MEIPSFFFSSLVSVHQHLFLSYENTIKYDDTVVIDVSIVL
jgi:hypothetical protein